MRRLGLSVWAPIIRKPVAGPWPAAVAQATRLPDRRRYQRPVEAGHASRSSSSRKPAASRRAAASAQAWNGDGAASMNVSMRRAASRGFGASAMRPACLIGRHRCAQGAPGLKIAVSHADNQRTGCARRAPRGEERGHCCAG